MERSMYDLTSLSLCCRRRECECARWWPEMLGCRRDGTILSRSRTFGPGFAPAALTPSDMALAWSLRSLLALTNPGVRAAAERQKHPCGALMRNCEARASAFPVLSSLFTYSLTLRVQPPEHLYPVYPSAHTSRLHLPLHGRPLHRPLLARSARGSLLTNTYLYDPVNAQPLLCEDRYCRRRQHQQPEPSSIHGTSLSARL
jgi:hypothetical protein